MTENFYYSHATDNPDVDDRLRKVIALVLRDKPRSVLDIGCGRGTLIDALRGKAPDTSYVGIEISAELREMARSAGIDVVSHDLATRLPFEDGSFDTVILGEVIEHLFDPDSALDDIHRILSRDGRLVITTPNLACWLNRVLVPAGIQPIFTETSARKKYGRRLKILGQGSTVMQGHIRVMTTAALLELLRDRGYVISDVVGCKFCDLERNPITNVVDGLFTRFPTLASGVIAVARKGDGRGPS